MPLREPAEVLPWCFLVVIRRSVRIYYSYSYFYSTT